jgi:uncharacterized membrane protein
MDLGIVTCGLILLAVVVVFAVVIGLYFYSINQINKRLQLAFASYRQSLEILKQQPNDPELRQKALEWGRYYSNLTRDNKGVTVYDEVALANDINAACAGGVHAANDPTATATRPIEQRLDQLKALFDKGAIDEQEYSERRAKLLDEV